MMDRLDDFRGKKFIGVAELASVAAQILENSDSQQQRGTVTEFPDERTIRYYLTEGLIPAPIEKQGTASVFEYIHLLMLLAVKKLQAEHLPIRKIREIIGGKSKQELERLLGVDEMENASSKNEAQEYLEALLLQKPEPPAVAAGSMRFSQAVPPQPPAPLQIPAMPKQTPGTKHVPKWRRFEIAPGLELHLEENFRTPSDAKELQLFIEAIRQIIQSAR